MSAAKGKKAGRAGIPGLNFWTAVVLLTLAFVLVFIAYPFSRMLIQSSQSKEQAFTLNNYVRFFAKRYYYDTLLNSFKVCFAATAAAALLGAPMAYISTRFDIRGKQSINIAIVISLLSPPFIGAYSWIMLLGRNGFLTNRLRAAGLQIGSIYGFKGILLVFTLKLYPYVYMYVSAALGSIDASLEEAGENLGISGIERLMRITFPLILPTLLSSALMVFMTALADYGTPLMIGKGYKVLPVVICEEYLGEISGSVTFASALSVIVVLCSTTVLFIQKRVVDKRNYNMSLLRPPEIKHLTAGKRFLATAFVWKCCIFRDFAADHGSGNFICKNERTDVCQRLQSEQLPGRHGKDEQKYYQYLYLCDGRPGHHGDLGHAAFLYHCQK